jgi:hypothetical protein
VVPAVRYRWGKFQGIACLLLGCSLLFAGGYLAWEEGAAEKTLTAWIGGVVFCATGIGLTAKKRYGVVLVCVLFATTLLLPLTGHKPKYAEGYLFHALGVIFWGLPALFYYPKRWKTLR